MYFYIFSSDSLLKQFSVFFQAFENCPQTLEELDDEIHRHQAKADSIFQIDETVSI